MPNEIIDYIMSFMDEKTKTYFMICCKRFQEFFNNNGKLQCINYLGIKFNLSNKIDLRYLSTHNIHIIEANEIDNFDQYKWILENSDSIISLDYFKNTLKVNQTEIIIKTKNLINLNFVTKSVKNIINYKGIKNNINLTTLTISHIIDSSTLIEISKLTNLTTLNIILSNDIQNILYLSKLSNLRILSIMGNGNKITSFSFLNSLKLVQLNLLDIITVNNYESIKWNNFDFMNSVTITCNGLITDKFGSIDLIKPFEIEKKYSIERNLTLYDPKLHIENEEKINIIKKSFYFKLFKLRIFNDFLEFQDDIKRLKIKIDFYRNNYSLNDKYNTKIRVRDNKITVKMNYIDAFESDNNRMNTTEYDDNKFNDMFNSVNRYQYMYDNGYKLRNCSGVNSHEILDDENRFTVHSKMLVLMIWVSDYSIIFSYCKESSKIPFYTSTIWFHENELTNY